MSNKNKNKTGIIFSTNPNFQFQFEGTMEQGSLPPSQQNLRIWLEKNHRGGKEVTIIKNFVGSLKDLESLCKEIKTKCGTGGSVKESEILIQGDQRKKIADFLTTKGYKFKLAGA